VSKFTKGQIVVATKTRRASCGRIIIHEGAIVKVADPHRDSWNDIEVYKSLKREKYDHITDVNEDTLRAATEAEILAFAKGVRNISMVTT